MANSKVSDLTAVDNIADDDDFLLADTSAAASKRATGSQIASYVASATSTLTNKTFDANGTGNSISNVDLSADVTGTLPVTSGGTGNTTYTNGQLLIGNTTGNTLTKATLTEGAGIDITNGTGTITIAGETASDTNAGIVELATTAETTTGTDTGRAIPVSALPSQIQDSKYTFAADAEANDSYAITLTPAPTAYAAGQVFHFSANTANTGPATLNVNSLGAVTIKKNGDSDLANNDIKSGQHVTVIYDGTNFQMQSQLGNAPAGSGDMVLADTQTVTGAKTFNSSTLICAGSTSGTTTLNATAIAGTTTLTLPAATDTLIGKATTDTLTNKTFDANGTGNSLSNVDVADLANGTDGELITWDSSGAPATVAAGSSGQVLTSNGAGAAPTFQAASGGDLVLISSATASGSATIDFTGLSSTYHMYLVEGSTILPATNTVEFWVRISIASTFSTSSLYSLSLQGTGASTVAGRDTSNSRWPIMNSSIFGSLTNTTNTEVSFRLWLMNPSDTSAYKTIAFEMDSNGSTTTASFIRGSGFYQSNSAIDGIRFLMSSGNIATGNFRLYGYNAT